MIVLSPSNMDSYIKCPLRFAGQAVIKDIKWKASKSKSRGTAVHAAIEKCLKLGWQPQYTWDSQIDLDYVRRKVNETQQRLDTHALFIECEMAINTQAKPCDWWAHDALLRAKADAVMLPKDPAGTVYLIDIKTGRKWDEEDFQLRVECLLAHLVWQAPTVQYEYWYVDEGETCDGFIDFANGLGPVQDIYDTMREVLLAVKNNDFPPKRNKFCKWCDYFHTPRCPL